MLVSLFFVLISLVGLYRPSWFVVFYILASSDFLGFASLSMLTFNNLDVGFFSLNLSAFSLASAAVLKAGLRIPKVVAPLVVCLILLFLWGLLGPFFLGYQSFLQSTIASKHFFSFSLLYYLFAFRNQIQAYLLVRACKTLGVYLSLAYVLNLALGYAPAFYEIRDSISHSFIASYIEEVSNFRAQYPTYISLAAFLFYLDLNQNHTGRGRFLAQMAITVLIFGLMLSGFEALTITTGLGLAFAFLIGRSGFNLRRSKFLYRSVLVLLVSVIPLTASETLRESIFERVQSIVTRTDSALVSRSKFNEFRWKALNDRPILGYGFLHKDSPIMSSFEGKTRSRFTETLGVIDSGYVDLLVRFGYLGTFFYLFFFGRLLTITFRRHRESRSLGMLMCIFLSQYYIVGFTWSVFTFPHGIIPLSLALYFAIFYGQAIKSSIRT